MGTTNETFQQSGKQNSFRHLLKSSAGMKESSGSQFYRTTTGIQSGPDAFDAVMTFLIISGVTEILCSFKLVLERKTGKEIPESSRLEFIEMLEMFSANNFALSGAENNTSGSLNSSYSRFTFVENTISNSAKVPRAKFLGRFFRFRRFILLVQMKKVISMNYGSCTSS